MKLTVLAATAALLAAPAFAGSHGGPGDAAAGEGEFRGCAACHSIVDPDGNRLAGRGAKTGPNLYGIVGQAMGAQEGFRYRDGMKLANEQGLVWDAESLAEYIPDPQGYIRTATGDASVRVGMARQRVKNIDDLVAFLALNSPVAEDASN